jgi:hypothetical protein
MEELELTPLSPLAYFSIHQEIKQEGTVLPNTSSISGERPFCEVTMGWEKKGLRFFFEFSRSFDHPLYPSYDAGDSIELYIDTRDVKSGFNTRYCHHFFLLPKAVDGVQAGEVTHFRTDDRHEHCDPDLLEVINHSKKRIELFIPAHCLHGYDTDQFDRCGFAYRINRFRGDPQHFSVSSADFQIDQQPSLWSSVRFI